MKKRLLSLFLAIFLVFYTAIGNFPFVFAQEVSEDESEEENENFEDDKPDEENPEEESDNESPEEGETKEDNPDENEPEDQNPKEDEPEEDVEIILPHLVLNQIKNNAGYLVTDENGNYYFDKFLTISFLLEEAEEPAEEDDDEKEENNEDKEVEDDVEKNEEDEKEYVIKRNEEEIYRGTDEFIEDILNEEGTYIYTVEDLEGNQAEEIVTIAAKHSDARPEAEIICLSEQIIVEENYYFNAEQFEAFDIMGDIKDEFGIVKIAYKKETQEEYQTLVEVQDMSYISSYQDSLLLGELKTELENPKDGAYSYLFQITNCLGNITEKKVEFQLDRTTPEEKVYVSYTTDIAEETGILDFLQTSLKKLFGKEKIQFDLYVKDAYSGIDAEDLRKQIFLKQETGKIEELEIISANGANFELEGQYYENYTHIRGYFNSDSNSNVKNQLSIGRLLDLAGNYLEQIEMQEIIGTTVLYLDNETPKLSVDYKNEEVILQNNLEKRYYKTDALVSLMLRETYYEEQTDENDNIVVPKIEFLGENQVDIPSWELADLQDYHAKAEFIVPCILGEELEYQFNVSYQDASGNLMEMSDKEKGVIREGTFTSQILVLDGRAPELLSFEVKVTEQMEIFFVLDENPDDWKINKQQLIFEVIEEGSQKSVVSLTGKELLWKDNERIHSTSYIFEGQEGIASNYLIRICYMDCAKNQMAAGANLTGGNLVQGNYLSDAIFLDCEAPIFSISYNPAYRLIYEADRKKEYDKLDACPETGYRAYYKENIIVKFSIEEVSAIPIYANGILIGLEDFVLKINESTENVPSIMWTKAGQVYKGSFILEAEENYCIEMQYMDSFKNQMAAGEIQANQWGEKLNNGTYQSEYLTIDKTAPVVTISYLNSSFKEISPQRIYEAANRYYFNEEVYLRLNIKDKNIRYEELKEVLAGIEAFDIEQTVLSSTNASAFVDGLDGSIIKEDEFQIEIPLTNEINYIIPTGIIDILENASLSETQYVTVDKENPELEVSYEVSEATYKDVINYKNWGFLFADNKITITASGKDQVSGIYQICFFIIDEDGKEIYQIQEFEPVSNGNYTIVLPLYGEDFKGTIRAELADWSNHQVEEIFGYIIESESKHENSNQILLNTYTSPSRVVNGVNYYNTDIKLNVYFQDSYSGLKNLDYIIGDLSKSVDYAKKAGDSLETEATEEIVYEYSEELTLLSAANNQNDILVQMNFTDNTGHKESFADYYHIDVTVPVIEVEYDINNPENGSYYSSERKATVSIWERNFDEKDVNFIITNTDGVMPLLGEWKHEGSGDETKHSCEILFLEDGDYTFSVEFQDMAGNVAEYHRVDEFTIDKTLPIVTVTYDNYQSENEYYYSKSRTATIDVEEHNFDDSLIEIAVETPVNTPVLSAWKQQGDHYIVTMHFQEDAEYRFDIRGKDLAGNSLAEYEQDYFIIDQTFPELEISNVLDQSANSGKVMPKISYSDTNYDAAGVEISLIGYQNGTQNIKQTRFQFENRIEIQLEDFPYTKDVDDMYILEVQAEDKAGNKKDARIQFSVNRFGSVYTFHDQTNVLLEHYYTNEEQDIEITETNVDTLEFQQITCNCNGNLSVLELGKNYTLKETGTEGSWKQYTYKIAKKNFVQEGVYILTIYSEDRARNVSDNDSKEKKIEFVVDKTKPSILISGVENQAQYRENSREVTLDIQDNLQLEQVEIQMDNKKLLYAKDELKELNGRITTLLENKNDWQTMYVKAIDAAGNETISEQLRFLITANVFVQLMMNKKLLTQASVTIIILGIGVGFLQKFRKRNNG